TIVNAALNEAEVIGGKPVAEVTADITTAYTDSNDDGVLDTRDDRSSESTLGNLVANALRDSVAEQPAGADIGVVNPGGLRSDLLYAGSTGGDADVNKDGVITYAEANAVLPFTNNLYSVSMTGAQFKKILEQQWQRTAGGAIPSRQYLQLGLSDNARYTFDPQAPEGEHIIDVIVDGKPIDEDATYKIATFSFLAAGGDNFHEFKNAQSVDTGLVDREAWIDYLGDESPVLPSFARRAVAVNDLPESVSKGSTLSFNLSQLDLTSLGSPANTKVSSFTLTSSGGQSTELPGEAGVTNGAAPVDVVIPSNVAPGRYTLTGVAIPSGTTFSVPVEVQKADSQIAASQAPPTRVKANKTKAKIHAEVTVSGFTPSGKVTVYFDGKPVGEASLKKGSAKIRLDRFRTTGTKELSVVYAGNDDANSSTTTVTIQVVR
ncbi:MAG: 5'-nucleotidase C-terminal domain-containing protein, partial [Propionibacteriales bacterium]|nr:5'-nucleotidase C-terminal domain-containing protein [Propionibacteriales bacterium]